MKKLFADYSQGLRSVSVKIWDEKGAFYSLSEAQCMYNNGEAEIGNPKFRILTWALFKVELVPELLKGWEL